MRNVLAFTNRISPPRQRESSVVLDSLPGDRADSGEDPDNQGGEHSETLLRKAARMSADERGSSSELGGFHIIQ